MTKLMVKFLAFMIFFRVFTLIRFKRVGVFFRQNFL